MRTIVVLLAVCFVLSGCASMKAEMVLPEELSDVAVYPVQNRRMLELGAKPMFDFGSWQVARFSRGWAREAASNLFWVETVDRAQRYSFVLEGSSDPIDVICAARADIDRWGGPDSSLERVHSYELRCEGLMAEMEDPRFTLEVGTRIGHLEWEGDRLMVIPTNDLKGSRWKLPERTGYVIEDRNGPIAAVEVLSPGRVWMTDEITPELVDVIAAATSALLLYDTLVD